MSRNSNLHKAKKERNDEFYTQLSDIEKEMAHYTYQFKDKVVYCNCDDYRRSNFWKYFYDNFNELGIKRLTATNYEIGEGAYRADYDCENMTVVPLQGNGDFRSAECVEFLKEADIVVTNPPFSLFREYIAQLMEYGKKFIVLGNMNAITYKEIFPLIKDNQMWWGVSLNGTKCSFIVPEDYEGKNVYRENGVKYGKVNNAIWFTNLEHNKRHRPIDLYKHYSNEYKHYDNYNAIEVGKVCDIPMDYDGVMGVPITFLDKYCPDQFEIVDARECALTEKTKSKKTFLIKDADGAINGKPTYARITIKRKSF